MGRGTGARRGLPWELRGAGAQPSLLCTHKHRRCACLVHARACLLRCRWPPCAQRAASTHPSNPCHPLPPIAPEELHLAAAQRVHHLVDGPLAANADDQQRSGRGKCGRVQDKPAPPAGMAQGGSVLGSARARSAALHTFRCQRRTAVPQPAGPRRITHGGAVRGTPVPRPPGVLGVIRVVILLPMQGGGGAGVVGRGMRPCGVCLCGGCACPLTASALPAMRWCGESQRTLRWPLARGECAHGWGAGRALPRGALPHGTLPHGMLPHAALRHGALHHGALQHGALQHGVLPHGALPRGALRMA